VFIKNFAHHLVKLTRKEATFEYGPQQIEAQEDTKQALLTSPALKPIDYTSDMAVVLSVNTSHIAVGYLLCQCDREDPKK
jgi:hypothetical protein